MALFLPFRALGYITDDVPFAVQRRGKETYVTVSVGKSWQARYSFGNELIMMHAGISCMQPQGMHHQPSKPAPFRCCTQVYNVSNLRLALVGPQFNHGISALACKGDLTFAAVGGAVTECKRVHRTGIYRGHSGAIIQLMVLGEMLFSLGADQNLIVWRIGEYDDPEAVIQLPQGFVPTCMAHPDTYLNKIVVGSDDGRMQLWNFSSGKLIHEFASLGSAVRCIAPSPALDVVGIGLADG